MPLRCQKRTLDATLARVAKVALIVEDVVHSIHEQVVWNQKEEGSDEECGIQFAGDQKVGSGEWKRGVDPRNRSRRPKQLIEQFH